MKNKTILIIIFSFFSLIPISNYSLWIDESTTAYFASQTNIADLNDQLFSTRESELQMPGYIYYMWAWEKIFGHNEFMLRLSNLPFIILLIIVIAFSPLTDRMKILLGCFISFSPFLWYNLNEARSTVPVFSFGGLSISSLVYYFSDDKSLQKKGIWIFTASLIAGASFNMLFLLVIPVVALLFIMHSIYNKRELKTLIKDWWLGICIMGLLIGTMTLYYVWTLSLGAGGVKEAPSISNTAFVFYEFLGFSGVGPPRSLLRESRSFEMIKAFIPLMILFFSAYLLLFIFIIRGLWKQSKTWQIIVNPYLVSLIFGILIFNLVGSISQFKFLGRHAAFLLPLMIYYFAQMIDDSWTVESLKHKFLIPIFLLFALMLISDFNIRFNTDYQKENNKEASIKAIELVDNKGIIIWNGHDPLAGYYGLKITNTQQKMPVTWPVYRNAVKPPYTRGLSDYLNKFRGKNAVLVVFNRQVFDNEGYYQDYIKTNALSALINKRDYSIYSME